MRTLQVVNPRRRRAHSVKGTYFKSVVVCPSVHSLFFPPPFNPNNPHSQSTALLCFPAFAPMPFSAPARPFDIKMPSSTSPKPNSIHLRGLRCLDSPDRPRDSIAAPSLGHYEVMMGSSCDIESYPAPGRCQKAKKCPKIEQGGKTT